MQKNALLIEPGEDQALIKGFRSCSAKVTLPQRIVEKVRQEAEKQGLSIEEHVIEILGQGLDPSSRAASYIEAAETLLGQARDELRRGDVRRAAEKLWGAAALAIKAYASWGREED